MTASPNSLNTQTHRCTAHRPVPVGTRIQRAPWRTIDVHCHGFCPPAEALAATLPRYAERKAEEVASIGEASNKVNATLLGTLGPKLVSVESRLADMDAMGVDIQLISPSPTQYHYWVDRDLAPEIVGMQNDSISQVCAAFPERFVGLGAVALQDPQLAADQLSDLMRNRGFKGAQISSLVNGRDIADPCFLPFWSRADELGAVIFIHPWGTTLGTRLSDHYLMNTIGQPFETTVCLSKLIFSGVLERHPRLRIIAAHGGGYLPAYPGRSDHAHAVRPELDACQCAPSAQLRQLWFDSLVFDPGQLRELIERVGEDRVLLGTDYPFDMGHYDPAGLVASLPLGQQKAVLGDNAARLLGLP
jgi:aminocarboxymuconate-semialdehyde decarboxylase